MARRIKAQVSMAELEQIEPAVNNNKVVVVGGQRGLLDTEGSSVSLQTGLDLPIYVDFLAENFLRGRVNVTQGCEEVINRLSQAGRFTDVK